MKTALREDTARLLNKVPAVTLFFWIIKIMCTTVGETGADYLIFNQHLGIVVTSLIMGGLLLAALCVQVLAKKYIPGIYWVTVVLISIVGTLVTDYLVDNLGVPLQTTTIIFSVALAATFIAWYAFEKTLSIHTIFTLRRELFYWAAILFTFALGTAAGDLSSEQMKLGYATSAVIYGAMIGIVALAYYSFKLNAVLAFWIAYILTRPFGASCGDYLSQPAANGGLGLGTVTTSTVFLVIILGLTVYFTISEKKTAAGQKIS